jgi:hypothetical protein
VSLLLAVVGPLTVVLGTLLPGAPWWLTLLGFVIVLAGLATGLAVIGGTRPVALEHRVATRRQRVPVAVAGAALMLAVIVLGSIDLLVWNPLAKVPGTELSTIYALMAERDGFSLQPTLVALVVWVVFWTVPTLLITALAVHRAGGPLTPRRLAIAMLALVGAAIFCRFFTGFGIGMSIADTFYTSGGDGSAVSAALAIVGQLSFAAAAILLGWAPRVVVRRAESAVAA